MKEKFLFYLLDIIQKNGDVRRLQIEGVNFEAVGQLTALALEKGYISFESNNIVLTQKGIEKIRSDEKEYRRVNKDAWILPATKSKVAKIDKNEIFLPSQDELSF